MRTPHRLLLVIAIALLAFAPMALAQTTTGNIAGTVSASGEALPGVTIEAVHVPTGTRYDTVSGANGRYLIPNVRVGGPYRISANLEGFRAFEVTSISVPLGATAEVAVNMQLSTVSEAITVTASADAIINPNRTGSTSAVSEEQIEQLPTVNRQIQDFARTNPYFNTSLTGDGTFMFVAGRNNRYNSIQIDGAVNNDLFGLAASGTPGGQAGTQPISLDAIEQLQMLVSPYDVRQSGFTGGGVNAVTRSGTNELHGSVFGSKRSEQFIGEGPFVDETLGPNNPGTAARKPTEFTQDQYGGRLGGPILRDRLFFFVSGEKNDRTAPTGVSAAGDAPTQVNANLLSALTRVENILSSNYSYDAGGLGEIQGQTGNDTIFGRVDFNLANRHQVTLRHNFNDGGRDNIGTRTASRYTFPNSIYRQANTTNQTVAQINSVFTANTYNEARISYQTIKDARTIPTAPFPSIEIGGSPQNATIAVGSERFSGANALDQNILEVTDDFTWIRGGHTLIFGTHNEFFEFKNLFMSDAYGAYFFSGRLASGQNDTALAPSLDAFEANRPTEFRITFATGDDPRRPTAFEAAA